MFCFTKFYSISQCTMYCRGPQYFIVTIFHNILQCMRTSQCLRMLHSAYNDSQRLKICFSTCNNPSDVVSHLLGYLIISHNASHYAYKCFTTHHDVSECHNSTLYLSTMCNNLLPHSTSWCLSMYYSESQCFTDNISQYITVC